MMQGSGRTNLVNFVASIVTTGVADCFGDDQIVVGIPFALVGHEI
jgi:hypothetical protein